MDIKRRTFLLGGSGLLAHRAPSARFARSTLQIAAAAPSNQLVLGVIGSGGRGTAVMKTFQTHAEVIVGAICDVYEPNLEQAISVAAKGNSHPKTYRNYKDL